MEPSTNKRFIEIGFPVREVGEESAKEKNIRQGHISTLHGWWARRPLAASRATIYASLVPTPMSQEELNSKESYIIELSKWKNSLNQSLMERARRDIIGNSRLRVRVLDPFAGGGAIPLESLRLGCETYATEYNPVAVLILKATLEFPQRYGFTKQTMNTHDLKPQSENRLLEDVRKWGNYILREAKSEIGRFYPERNGRIPVAYLWARTIHCQNPSCTAEMPLLLQFWLAKKKNRSVALGPIVKEKHVEFEVVEDPDFDPSRGTIRGAIATCLVCGSTVDEATIGRLLRQDKGSQRMVAVVDLDRKKPGKLYHMPTENDLEVFREAERYLQEKRQRLMDESGIDPVPDEYLNQDNHDQELYGTRCIKYGLRRYSDLFNPRQILALITFEEKVRSAYREMMSSGYDREYAKAVTVYLALGVDRLADFGCTLCTWNYTGGRGVGHALTRQAIPMVWDYPESNPFNPEAAGWATACEKNEKWIEHASRTSSFAGHVGQGTATKLPFDDSTFDAVFTDPPYYDNVNYAELSDFFYVWLKRSLADLFPDLFTTPLTPKADELVANPLRHGGRQGASKFFEDNLRRSFQEINRVLKMGGIATIVYAHKSTSGWESLLNSILDSGLTITGSWPINTEMKGRLGARETASLASSIYIVTRKLKKEELGWYNEVKEEIKKYVNEKLERLWLEGISGADYFIAAIGSAIEIFGKYEKVMDYEGNIIRADKLIDFIRNVVTDYVARQLLHNGIVGELTPLTKFYLLWRWTYQDKVVHFDDARKLAQSTGIDLASEWNRGFIVKDKEFIKVLGPHERTLKEPKEPSELIDLLHHVLALWREGKKDEMKKILRESGWGNRDAFYRIAQAISETLPLESKEKKLLDGFLSGKERMVDEAKRTEAQAKLFE